MSLDGPNGPIIQDTPVMLLSNKQEWVITKGEGENVYRWVSFGSLVISSAQTLTATNRDDHQYQRCRSIDWCQYGY